jgi:hypothetical protein
MSYLRVSILSDGKTCDLEELTLLGVQEARFQAQRLADDAEELAHKMEHDEDEEADREVPQG